MSEETDIKNNEDKSEYKKYYDMKNRIYIILKKKQNKG